MRNRSFDARPAPIKLKAQQRIPQAKQPPTSSPRDINWSGTKLDPCRWSPSGWRYIDNEMEYLNHPNKRNAYHPRPRESNVSNEFRF